MMESLETHFKGIILNNLHHDPRRKRIQHDIMDWINVKLADVQLITYRKQLVMEGLITEEEPDEVHSLIAITPKGYEVIERYGNYQSFLEAQTMDTINNTKLTTLNIKQLRIKNLSILINIILAILGILLTSYTIYQNNQINELKEMLYKSNIEIPIK
nr:MAG TPA: Transcriptional regulator, MarR/EmrR family, emrR, transcriptional regulator, DNA-binding [Siphoviridae sp. ctEfY6]